MPVKLTDRYIKGLKAKTSQYEKNGGNGFMIRVSPRGTKVFRFQYWIKGKAKYVTIGEYPAVTLEEARKKYNELREAYKRGDNPATVGTVAEGNTLADLAKEYIDKRAKIKNKESSWKEYQRLIDKELYVFADRPAGAITRRDIVLFLEGLRDVRGLGRTVNIIHA